MGQGASIAALIGLAAVAANLPFLNSRWLAVLPAAGGRKGLGGRLLELVFWYFATGAVGLALEARAGQIYPQGWEFYAITAALFLTLAFPGFVYCYLLKRGN